MHLSIIIPAHNEEKRIVKTLEGYGRFFSQKIKEKAIKDCEIVIVINNTTDRTSEIVKEFEKRYKIIRHLEFKPGGKGFAIIEGWKDVKGDLIGFVDADMATSPEAFYELVENIRGCDGVIASRWLPESKILTKQPPLRVLTGIVFNFFVRCMFLMPFKDTQCGAKVFKKEVIRTILSKVGTSAWAFDVDLMYNIAKAGFKIKEWPTVWQDKKDSRIRTSRISIQMLSAITRLRLNYSPFNFIVRAYDKLLPDKLKFHNLK